MATVVDLSGNSPIGFKTDKSFRKSDAVMRGETVYGEQLSAVTTGAVQSSTFPNIVDRVRIVGEGEFRYVVNGTASATSPNLLPADVVEYIDIDGGDYISVFGITTGTNTVNIKAGR